MFPLESAVTGEEVCPAHYLRQIEQHTTGDVAFAVTRQYCFTRNRTWLREAWPLVQGCATFWAGRFATTNGGKNYTVRGVVGPDGLTGPVNDDAYTNALAGKVLKAAVVLSQEIGEAPGANRSRIASSVYLPTSTAIHPNSTVHLENDRCRKGQMIEQDDVGLFQYPLGLEMPRAVKAADLAYYQGVTDANGFCTGDSSYSIAWLAGLGNRSSADAQFDRAFLYHNGHPSSACNTSKPPQGPCLWSQYNPFLVWKERANYGGHVNFLTGAGGFLQNLLQGYAGIRARMTGFAFDPVLPPYVDMIHLVGVKYAGATFSVAINVSTMVVELTASSSALQLVVAGKAQAMVPLVPMAYARQPFVVQVVA